MPSNHQLLQGAQELIVCIISFFVGMLTIQCWCYFRSDNKDGLVLRSLVALLLILELAGMVCRWQGFYVLAVRPDHVAGSDNDPLLTLAPVLMNSFNGPLVQAWYIYRIYALTGHRIFPALCWLLSFALLALNFTTTIGLAVSSSQLQWKLRWNAGYATTMVLGAAIDVIITVALCSFFFIRRNTGIRRTTKLIDVLIAWTIQTGLVTSFIAVSALVIFFVAYDSYAWIFLVGILSRVYPNTMVATLNARHKFNKIANGTVHIDAATASYAISPQEVAFGGSFLASPLPVVGHTESIREPSASHSVPVIVKETV